MKKIRETFVHLVGIFLFGLVYGGGKKGKKKETRNRIDKRGPVRTVYTDRL